MLVKIQGVLLDGSGSALPIGQPFSVPQGVDATVQLSVTGQNGAAVDLTGYTVTLSIKSAPVGGIPIATLTAALNDPTHGVCAFSLPGTTTRALLGTFVYDVFVKNPDNLRDEVVSDSFVEITQAVGA